VSWQRGNVAIRPLSPRSDSDGTSNHQAPLRDQTQDPWRDQRSELIGPFEISLPFDPLDWYPPENSSFMAGA